MELKISFNFLFSSFPLLSIDLRTTEKADKWNFNSRCPGILWRKMLFLESLFSSTITLENITTTSAQEEASFWWNVCNAGKAACVKSCSEILIPLQ